MTLTSPARCSGGLGRFKGHRGEFGCPRGQQAFGRLHLGVGVLRHLDQGRSVLGKGLGYVPDLTIEHLRQVDHFAALVAQGLGQGAGDLDRFVRGPSQGRALLLHGLTHGENGSLRHFGGGGGGGDFLPQAGHDLTGV